MWKDIESPVDFLGYQVNADLLSKIVLTRDMLPISIGIFGDWGKGKSSLMLLMQASVQKWIDKTLANNDLLPPSVARENCKVLQIKFNSWQFENYGNTKLTLVEQILSEVVNDIKKDKSLFDKADELIGRINYLKAGVLALKKIYSFVTPQSIKDLMPTVEEFQGIIDETQYEELLKEISPYNTSKYISNFRSTLEQLIETANYRSVIVYIDDLDRCAPERIIDCLEAVKLFLNVKGTAFVIGADERVLQYAIDRHYPNNSSSNEGEYSPFSDYLEKLIQIPFKLPKLSLSEQETYILLLLCQRYLPTLKKDKPINKFLEFRETDKHTKYSFKRLKEDCPEIDFTPIERILPIIPLMQTFLNGNPRRLKRFMNALDLRLELAEVANFQDIRPEILVKLMVLEYTHMLSSRFEELYNFQIADNTINDCHGAIKDIKEIEEQAKNGNITSERWKDNWSSDILKNWLKSEPSLVDVDLRDYFWLSRESLKDSLPVESMISSKVYRAFSALYKGYPTITALKPEIKRIFGSILKDEDDKLMFVYLINGKLIKNPADKQIWQILVADEDNLILCNKINKLKLLLENVDLNAIDTQASAFFRRVKNTGDLGEFYNSLESKFEMSLIRAINRS